MQFSAMELLKRKREEVNLNKTNEIKSTKDYHLFSFMNRNRSIDKNHVKKLKKAISVKYIPVPIIVNDKMQIIDGQHRFVACKELDLPIYYTVISKCTLKDVQALNIVQKKWVAKDYLDSHIKAGNKNYAIFKSVMNEHKFGFEQTYKILSGGAAAGSTKNRRTEWEYGLFEVHDPEQAKDWLDKFKEIGQYYTNYNRRNFVFCMIYLFNHPQFDYDRFISKLEYQRGRFKDELDIEAYMDSINKIYNYNTKGKKTYFIYGEENGGIR